MTSPDHNASKWMCRDSNPNPSDSAAEVSSSLMKPLTLFTKHQSYHDKVTHSSSMAVFSRFPFIRSLPNNLVLMTDNSSLSLDVLQFCFPYKETLSSSASTWWVPPSPKLLPGSLACVCVKNLSVWRSHTESRAELTSHSGLDLPFRKVVIVHYYNEFLPCRQVFQLCFLVDILKTV